MGYLNMFIPYRLIVFSDIMDDVIWYFAGYFGGKRIVGSGAKYFGLSLEEFQGFRRLIEKFRENQGMVLFIAKLTHALGFPFLIASGALRLDIKRFILFNFLAALPKTLFFMVLGYYFGKASNIIGRYLRYSTASGIILLAIAIGIYLLIQKYSSRLFKKYEKQKQ
jgi:membrane-associated protein